MSFIIIHWSVTFTAILIDFYSISTENHAPVVEIVRPKHNSVHAKNSLIPYSIAVSDREDGESKYDEIPGDQIFLRIEYIGRSPHTQTKHAPAEVREAIGLSFIKKSDCFSCHQFRSKLIGPSFVEIAMRYRETPAAPKLLADRIMRGSQGVWGEAAMPGHSDLPEKAAVEIANWILANGPNDRLDYLVGKEGSIRATLPGGISESYVELQASYTDNGLPGRPGASLIGGDTVIIQCR